jgi:hypothetical protein
MIKKQIMIGVLGLLIGLMLAGCAGYYGGYGYGSHYNNFDYGYYGNPHNDYGHEWGEHHQGGQERGEHGDHHGGGEQHYR